MNIGLKPVPTAEAPSQGWAAWSLIGISTAALLVLGVTTFNEHSVAADSTENNVAEAGTIIEMQGMRFIPDVVEVPSGEKITLTLVNQDSMAHDLKIANVSSGRVLPGNQTTMEIGPITEDTEGWCTIAGHKNQGMILNLKVTAN